MLAWIYRRWQLYRLVKMQRKGTRLINDECYHMKMQQLISLDLQDHWRKRDELIEELDLTDKERKSIGICPKSESYTEAKRRREEAKIITK